MNLPPPQTLSQRGASSAIPPVPYMAGSMTPGQPLQQNPHQQAFALPASFFYIESWVTSFFFCRICIDAPKPWTN
ncbi:MAG: hypothetical protein BYD32DRAFT_417496 [Podila humilis]|nr:MAG: hypothetical protein BYD32DRAFT_417496 [Podila humilis]